MLWSSTICRSWPICPTGITVAEARRSPGGRRLMQRVQIARGDRGLYRSRACVRQQPERDGERWPATRCWPSAASTAGMGESHVLHGVEFDVRPGEVVTLLGVRNGAGKTSTLCAIMGLLAKRTGSVETSLATRPSPCSRVTSRGWGSASARRSAASSPRSMSRKTRCCRRASPMAG